MARRAPSKVEVDMFPFLSVLCCVIGVMVLLMVFVFSTRVFEESAASAEVKIEQGHRQADLISKEKHDEFMRRIEKMQTTLIEKNGELKQLQEKADELEDLIATIESKKTANTENAPGSLELEKPENVEFRIDDSYSVNEKPNFIEVTFDSFIILTDNTEHPAEDLEKPNSDLAKFLKKVNSNRQNEYVVLLVHPNASENFAKAGRLLPPANKSKYQFEVGWEPFDANWRAIAQDIDGAEIK